MDDLSSQVRELMERTARIRSEFLLTELQSCSIGLAMAHQALLIGDREAAQREVVFVEKGLHIVERLIPVLTQTERSSVEARLAELKTLLETLQADITGPG